MARTLEFLFDFASPNGYLAYHALSPILARTGAKLEVTPVLLGGLFKATGNQAPMLAFANIKGKLDYDRLEIRRYIAKHGLTKFRMNPHFPVNTLMLMRGLVAARMLGKGDAYLEMGLAGMWEEGLKLDDVEVLAHCIASAGLDAKRILEDAQTPQIKQTLADLTAHAAERGAFGVPTFFVGEEMFFGKERLPQIEDELLKLAA
jgi:2-hydroxychromene-2-carboxylate isomerase